MDLTAEDFMPETEKQEVCFAEVTAVSDNGVQLLIDGEADPTEKYYKYLKIYKPAAGDRVYFVHISGTLLIIGPIEAEEAEAPELPTDLVLNSLTVTDSANISNLTVDTTFRHVGSATSLSLGFYGSAANSRGSRVDQPLSSASLSDVITRFNDLCKALGRLGIIYTS